MLASIALMFTIKASAQLGFCGGNSGDPIFTENFGTAPSSATQHVTLPAPGTTNYTFLGTTVFGDGKYTVTNLNYQQWNWFNVEDHTVADVNGRMLIVNASFTKGEFFRLPVTGLCENTTYEFSSWVLNLTPRDDLNAGSLPNPCNVRFEIWDSTDTTLLKSGDTGDFFGSLLGETGEWLNYGLVFQTQPGQTSVILKMVNNGIGGYGNDLAIDDIVFKSCGDSIAVSDGTNSNVSLCSSLTPYSSTLSAIPDNSVFSSHFYQWQISTDGLIWTDLVGETNSTITLSGITLTTYYRAKVAESATNLNNSLCNTLSDVFQIDITQAPSQPTIECWETATFNDTTCSWTVTGSQPAQPTLECWETVSFNNTTCLWEVSGTQPAQPTIDCWETATFNNASCSWDVTGTQPAQPTIECWETVLFNNTTCSWDVAETQPAQPTIDCWETATFNNASCSWDVTGTQPAQPTIECWETVLFNNTTCSWEVSGTQPTQPTIDCWETVIFNNSSCSWDVSGTQPAQPLLECWETAIFNDTTCVWDVTGTQPGAEFNEEIVICNGETPLLEANTNILNPVFQWEGGEISQSIVISAPGVYSVDVSSSTTCDFETRNFVVVLVDNPIIDTIIPDGNNIIVNTSNTGEFEYSIDGVNFQSSNTFINVEGGLYTISAKHVNCPDIDTTQYLHFFIPKFFTPNGDTINDTFDLKGIEFYSYSQVSIFDRYGKLLKSGVNTTLQWDGTYHGQLLPTGDYWYIIIIDNQKYTGHFTLKR
ncbi:T9SS type B sorting domain-containing protein [Algibacter sp.]|uniref:T9SS type B sorting domain-containing protein n=1 Tax=Algibacter sp. TaxID=1872428 RepID=UPI003C7688FF